MTISRAPFRISFAGGGTDIDPYAMEYGGCCLAVTIDQYCEARCCDIPSRVSGAMDAAISAFVGEQRGLILHNPLSAMAGLGGSAALCVAGLQTLRPMWTPDMLASAAFHVERKLMRVLGGYQDQLAAAHGGMLWMEFRGDDEAGVERLSRPDGLAALLFLVYMGPRPTAGSDVIREQMERPNLEALHRTKELAQAMKVALLAADWLLFGELLEESWQQKRRFSSLITTSSIDAFHDAAHRAGAMAFKLCGAGGGGYGLVMAHPAQVEQVQRFVEQHGGAAVRFSAEGAQIVQNNGPALARREERREQHHGWMG